MSDSSVTPWTVTCQAPQSMDFLDKDTGVGCHFLLQGMSDRTWISCILCFLHCRWILYHWAIEEALYFSFYCCSVTKWCQLFVTPRTAECQAPLSSTISQSLLKFMFIVSDAIYLIICLPFLLPPFFPASGFFPMSQLFTSGGQSIRASSSASVFPMNTQGWFPLELTALMS